MAQHPSFSENEVKAQIKAAFQEHRYEVDKEKKDDATGEETIAAIRDLFQPMYRKYLNVFVLERDPSLTDTIFKAIDAGNTHCVSSSHLITKVDLYSS